MEAGGQSSEPNPGEKEHFVDKYQVQLIHGVRNVEPILDELLIQGVIQQESCDKIGALPTSSQKMQELVDHLKVVGDRIEGKDIVYKIVEKEEPRLIKDIKTFVLQSKIVDKNPIQKGLEYLVGSMTELFFGTFNPRKMVFGSIVSPEDVWIKLEPEVNCVDAPTYSLQSEAGRFECDVSGLRWVCKEKVSFKYRFGIWEEHMERLEMMQYIPGGPLLNIKVTAGKLDEVRLPHWICTEDDPAILDKFAVLHIDGCGHVVERGSAVGPSHVTLSRPVFSPRGVLVRAGFPVKINCNVLIYRTNKAFLTLHVYLIPRDPGLQQTINNKELSRGSKMIQKPYPEKSLKMRHRFILTADVDSAEICPQTLKLEYESSDPNFFEVFIGNPNSDFQLTLRHESGPVWIRMFRKDDYQTTGDIHVKYDTALARVRPKLVARLSGEVINQLLDDLLEDGVLNDGEKDSILQENSTSADRARCLIDTVKKKGEEASRKTLGRLQSRDPMLSSELGLGQPLSVCFNSAGQHL